MQVVTTVGLDIAKSVFQVHGVDAAGQVVIRRQLKRRYVLAFFQKLPACLVGIEACASSHHWSRELKALGHTVKLINPLTDCYVPRCFVESDGGVAAPTDLQRAGRSQQDLADAGDRPRHGHGGSVDFQFHWRDGGTHQHVALRLDRSWPRR
jgi:hypothetical protein